MSLTSPNTPVSQQDLQDFYHKLLPYMGGSFGLIATGMDSANLYSTTERVVGQWIDGKPLYQKTVQSIAVEGINTINHNISNVDYIYIYKQIITYDGTEYHLNDQLIGNNGYSKVDRTSVTIASDNTGWLKGCLLTFTLQYTKTTDSAVESYGTDTTYSTDEHVVGSWIDGKPVYQKTLTGTAPASSATQNIQIGANVESALVISGYCQHESFLTPVNIQIDSNEYFMAWIRDNSNPNAPNTVGIKVGSALYNGSYRIVIQYTKTS